MSLSFASEIESYPITAKPVVPSKELHDTLQIAELAEVNSDLVVLEAKSVYDISSAFKQLGENCVIYSSQSEAELSEISSMGKIGSLPDLLVTEAKSSIHINSTSEQLPVEIHECPPAFEVIEHEVSVEYLQNGSPVGQAHSHKVVSEESCKENVGPTSDIQSAKLEINERHVQPDETRDAEVVLDNPSGIVILEAKSVHDISAAFKKLCEGHIDTGVAEVGSSNVLREPVEAQREKTSDGIPGEEEFNHVAHDHKEREGCPHSEVLEDSEEARAGGEVLVVDARSIEDIKLALNEHEQGGSERSMVSKGGPSNSPHNTTDTDYLAVQLDVQFVEGNVNLATEAFDEKSSEVEQLDDVLSSDASTFTKKRKDQKSTKSSSSSSSSSSDPDSD